MPEMNGLEFCRTLRKTEQGSRMYFLLLTGMVHDDELVEGFEAGADDYVTKPFNPRVLTARLRAATRVVNLQQESERDAANLRKFATELAVANRRLQQAALTDSLTGMPNRRYLLERVEQEWAAYARNQRPFSVMMIDIDGFKQINDTFGHEAGDQVLRQVAVLLRRAARTEDVVGRLGGEEFLVICPGTNQAMGVRVAERLRQTVASHVFQVDGVAIRVTVSIGISERESGMAHVDDLMRRADTALYRAKNDGRNRVQGARDTSEGNQTAVK
jgi:diguanylate cyclase (GGDEF)-like protein